MNAKLIAAIILIVLVLLFVVQNTNIVELRFLFWKLSMSGALLYILLLMIGSFLGWLLHSHRRKSKKTPT